MKETNHIALIRWIAILLSLLLLGNIILYLLYNRLVQEKQQLNRELETFRDQEKRSALLQNVSRQMEEIAYQQKDISEKRKQEAIAQTERANSMQRRAKAEKENAIAAQRETENAYRLAESQRGLAKKGQLQAEYSKRVADTLAFLALGRSLGTLSITQYQSGNVELASLLAYAASDFTQKYGGDVFYPTIFKALSYSCQQSFSWFEHKGAVTAIYPLIQSGSSFERNNFVTCSKYGELLRWQYDSKQQLVSKVLLNDAQYDFRSICRTSDGLLYALSYNGKLTIIGLSDTKVLPLADKRFRWLFPLGNNRLCAVSEHGIYTLDVQTYSIQISEVLSTAITCIGELDKHFYLFLEDGRIGIFTQTENVIRYVRERTNVSAVTAFCALSNLGYAVGCKDGTILICQPDGSVIKKLIGHQASITMLSAKDNKLFSSSYDGTLRMWDINNEKIKSEVILEHTAWIHSFCLTQDGRSIFIGDEQGGFYCIPFSPTYMANTILEKLTRDFTLEEWEYYIGSQIPFQSYRSKLLQP